MRAIAIVILVVTAAASMHAQALQAPPPAPPPPGWQPTPDAARPQPAAFKQHSITLTVAPKEGMEFKYRLDTGQAMLYSWTSTGPLFFEMHSQPDAAPRFAEFFEKSEGGTAAHGSYIAPFHGIHGWYWENRTASPVTITLAASGFFAETHEFRRGQKVLITPVP